MNLATIDMPIDKAREAMKEYRAAVKLRHNEEDAAILRGYREIVRGRRIIDIFDVLRASGVDDSGRPLLAICRAHFREVTYRRSWGDCYFGFGPRPHRIAARYWRNHLTLPRGVFPETRDWQEFRAMVPLIPPRLRPAGNLANYHILWEAVWEPAPPTDPFLLRHLGGPLYSVLAQWDLTPVERAVLALRPSN